MLVADTRGFPVDEIKQLRVGAHVLRRSRWPKLSGSGATRGLTTANWLFAMPVVGTMLADLGRRGEAKKFEH